MKKLEELREKILSKFGFKRLWLEKHGEWLELWGEFNPATLIACHHIATDKNKISIDRGGPWTPKVSAIF